MITISDLKKYSAGQKFGGNDIFIKTIRKDGSFVVSDDTGVMDALFNTKSQQKIQRGNQVHVIVGEVNTDPKTEELTLFIDQYTIPVVSEPPEYQMKTVDIKVNWNNLDSIKAGEKTKAYLENKGYTLINSFGGMTTAILVYAKLKTK